MSVGCPLTPLTGRFCDVKYVRDIAMAVSTTHRIKKQYLAYDRETTVFVEFILPTISGNLYLT